MKSKNKIYVSTGAFGSKKLKEILAIAYLNKIANIELSSGLDYESDSLKYLRQQEGKFNFLIHNYFPSPKKPFLLNLGSMDNKTIQLSTQLCQKAIDFCSILGSEFYSVHSGFAFNSDGSHLGNPSQLQLERADIKKTRDTFVENVSKLSDYAKKKNVKLAIENNCLPNYALIDGQNKTCLGASEAEMEDLLSRLIDNNVYFLFDLGHNKVNERSLGNKTASMLKKFNQQIIGLHLSENNGIEDQNYKIGSDSTLINYIKQSRDKYLILEAYNLSGEEIKKQINLISEALDE